MKQKPIIYQLLPRLFTNYNENCVPYGTFEQNGSGKLNAITSGILNAIKQLGITHVWYTGVIEHSHCADYSQHGIRPNNPHVIKGQAGSPYAITDYYDIDPDLAVNVPHRMAEFEKLVQRTHTAGLKAIIDFVPNHVAREYHSDSAPEGAPADFGTDDRTDWFFCHDNNFYYLPGTRFTPTGTDMGSGKEEYIEIPAKASGNDCFTASPGVCDWYDTVKLNYGVDYGNGSRHFTPIPSTWKKMLHILLHWAAKGIDGFRCDMVHMVPLEFWQWAIPQVKAAHPGIIFIAEIYDMNLYYPYIHTGGFDYLYDKVNLYDTLRAIDTCGTPAKAITGCWQRLGDLEPHMLNFLENHDEQRYASRFYAGDPTKAIPALTVSAMIGTGAMMIYAGQELGEAAADAEGYSGADGRTTIFDYWSVGTLRRWLNNGRPALKNLTSAEKALRASYARLLTLCGNEKAITDGLFFDLMYANLDNPHIDPDRQFAFLRHHGNETLLIAVNFGDTDAPAAIKIPGHAYDFFGLAPGQYSATELLTSREECRTLSPDTTFAAPIPAHGATIWKLTPR